MDLGDVGQDLPEEVLPAASRRRITEKKAPPEASHTKEMYIYRYIITYIINYI